MVLNHQQHLLVLVVLMGLFPHFSTAQIVFQETAIENNVAHQIEKGSIGAGVSFYDFNQDGLDDLTLGTERGKFIGFYVNTGDGFEGIPPLVNNKEEVKQILWADYDNDGDPDLYVAGYLGRSYLYRNEGNLQLVNVTQESGLPNDRHAAYGACWGDYNRDGWLDLLCNFRTFQGQAVGGNKLFRNNADGTFTDVTLNAEVSNPDRLPFASAFLDYNNDQWPDIYTANDKLTFNTLYENSRNGQFYDASVLTNSNARMNAMCVNAADVNQDGWVDIYITNTPIGGKFLQNNGPKESILDITFSDRAEALGISYKDGNGWSSTFFDADNDGDLDLYICGNSIYESVKGVHFYENIDTAHFEIITEGFEKDTFNSFSNAYGDFNGDGNLDIIVQNNQPTHFFLWENKTKNENHWIKIGLEGILSNRDGIGTRIETYAGNLYQSNYTHCGFGFLGQNSNVQHIGLQQHTILDSMIITWSSGHQDKFYNVEVDKALKIIEGQSTDNKINIAADVKIVNRPTTTSLNDIKTATSLRLMPNPASDYLQVKATTTFEQLEIWSIDGKLLKAISSKNKEIILDVTNLESGLYLLKITLEDGQFMSKSWVKRKK